MARRSLRGGGGFGRPHLIAAALAAQVALAGCYSYAPVEPAAAPPGSHVRIRVDPSTRLESGVFQMNENGIVWGRLLAGPLPNTLLCSVSVRAPVPGSTSRGLRETISLPMAAVDRVEVRTLDRTRTGLLVGAGAVLAVALVDAAFDFKSGRKPQDEGGGGINNAIVVTILTLRR